MRRAKSFYVLLANCVAWPGGIVRLTAAAHFDPSFLREVPQEGGKRLKVRPQGSSYVRALNRVTPAEQGRSFIHPPSPQQAWFHVGKAADRCPSFYQPRSQPVRTGRGRWLQASRAEGSWKGFGLPRTRRETAAEVRGAFYQAARPCRSLWIVGRWLSLS